MSKKLKLFAVFALIKGLIVLALLSPVKASGGVWGEVKTGMRPMYSDQLTTASGYVDPKFLVDPALQIKSVNISVSRSVSRNDIVSVYYGIPVDQVTGQFSANDFAIDDAGFYYVDAWYGDPYDPMQSTFISQYDGNYTVRVTDGYPIVASMSSIVTHSVFDTYRTATLYGKVTGIPVSNLLNRNVKIVIGGKCNLTGFTTEVVAKVNLLNKYSVKTTVPDNCLVVAHMYYGKQQLKEGNGELIVHHVGLNQ